MTCQKGPRKSKVERKKPILLLNHTTYSILCGTNEKLIEEKEKKGKETMLPTMAMVCCFIHHQHHQCRIIPQIQHNHIPLNGLMVSNRQRQLPFGKIKAPFPQMHNHRPLVYTSLSIDKHRSTFPPSMTFHLLSCQNNSCMPHFPSKPE